MTLSPYLTEVLQTPVELPLLVPEAQANGDLAWALKAIRAKAPDIWLFERYYRGDHRIGFATGQWRTSFGKIVKALNANYCPAVVDALTDRLRLGAITVSREDGEKDEDQTGVIEDAFTRNRFDRRAGAVHTMAAKHGESYLLIWPHPDTGRATFYPHSGDKIAVRHDDIRPGTLTLGAKIWLADKRVRATLYYPDRVERWATPGNRQYNGLPTSAKSFEPYDEDGEPSVFTNELGVVPIVPFLNNTLDGEQGRSELVDVIPIQDLNNKALADMLIAMEFAGFPQRWATGLIGDEKDPVTGQSIYPFIAGVERLFTSESADTTFGQFQSADLTQFVAVQDSLRSDIARVSRTPLHYLLLTGSFPSGEALHVAEGPLRAKVQDRQDEHGTSWEDVGRLVLIIDAGLAPEAEVSITAEWKSAASTSPAVQAEVAALHVDLGASQAQGLREVGYTEDEITKMRAEREDEGLSGLNAQEPEVPVGGLAANPFEQPA